MPGECRERLELKCAQILASHQPTRTHCPQMVCTNAWQQLRLTNRPERIARKWEQLRLTNRPERIARKWVVQIPGSKLRLTNRPEHIARK